MGGALPLIHSGISGSPHPGQVPSFAMCSLFLLNMFLAGVVGTPKSTFALNLTHVCSATLWMTNTMTDN